MERIDRDHRSNSGTNVADEIHVWSASSDVEPAQLRALWHLLSADERERAHRFRFPQDRRRFIARRGLLRAILARYLGAEPYEFRFTYGPFGRPALAAHQGQLGLDFSLSHSAGFVLLALTACHGIGIDVERIGALFDYRSVAANFFSPEEAEELSRVPRARACRIFFRLWSLREAVGKARGDGLAVLDDRQHHDGTLGESNPIREWSLTELDVGYAYAAALALCGRWQMRVRPWHECLDQWKACCRVDLVRSSLS